MVKIVQYCQVFLQFANVVWFGVCTYVC